MYLKSITLKGFKSFPDRTKLEFGPGVSVIVGPNGSGKSNVTDAVLWALGEQSPVNVRGQSMHDVIFGGGPGRRGSGHAEVELVLDDSEGSLALGASEISIHRRLDRNGEGEYRLAGARCRLVDIVELLSDTGLGKEMHSVISQGRVESIVTSKPRERRLLIEEAAGLGKHRRRRRRAQLKLARTQDNLDRALDVEREARSRLRPLKRQAEAAELHARLERQTLEIRWELARDGLRAQRGALSRAERAAGEIRARRAELEQQLQTVAGRREAAEESLATRSAHREELSRRSYAVKSAAERVGYRAEATRAAASSVQRRLARSTEMLESLGAAAAQEAPDPEAEARIAALAQELDGLDRDREAELARQLEALGRAAEAAQAAHAAQQEAVEHARHERERGEARSEAARAAMREAERAVEAARREAARIGADLAAVNQFLRHQAGSPGGARSLADELDTDPGYELALAAALDGRLRAAVVRDLAEGVELLDRVGTDGGRTLVLGGPAGGTQRPGPDRAERLLAHVRGRDAALELARRLLGSTWVVDTLEDLAPDFDGVAVTRSGRVWSARTRELRQTPAVGEERVLAERNRREELMRASAAAAESEHHARARLAEVTEAASAADGEWHALTAAHRAAVRSLDEAAEEQRRIAAHIQRRRTAPDDGPGAGRRSQITAELAAERQMLARAERERVQREAQLRRLAAAVDHDRRLAPAIAAVGEALERTATAIAEQLERFDAALSADRQAGEQAAVELRACAQEEAGLHARLQAHNESLTTAEVRFQRARDQAAEAEAELSSVAARLELPAEPAQDELAAEERDELRRRLERLARRREQLGPVNPLAQEEYAEAVAHVEELEAQRADLETALRELERLIADTDRQIKTTFEETFAATARGFEELAAQLFPGGSGRLRLVSERPGPARVVGGADAGEDQDAGGDPEADGAEAAGAGEGIEDLQGVEIEITPAGKESRRLSLLSGGEKSMTALAFLFAVFLARPCPFYILDEVEAALDDLNIDRFLTLLRQYASRAQFIVVTHQKRTMDAADSLYGVSMGSDGISKVISRRLAEAEAA